MGFQRGILWAMLQSSKEIQALLNFLAFLGILCVNRERRMNKGEENSLYNDVLRIAVKRQFYITYDFKQGTFDYTIETKTNKQTNKHKKKLHPNQPQTKPLRNKSPCQHIAGLMELWRKQAQRTAKGNAFHILAYFITLTVTAFEVTVLDLLGKRH